MNKFDENERNFQQFMETSRINNEDESQIRVQTPEEYAEHRSQMNFATKPMTSFSSVPAQDSNQMGSSSVKRNFSEIFEKMKNDNPENENITAKEIKIGDIDFPDLPEGPNLSMSQE